MSAFGQSPGDSAHALPGANLSAASVIVIDSAEIARSTARTFSELLQARRPGLRVFQQGGMASDGALVIIRGPTSVSAPSEPIVIVDGVRVDSRQYDPYPYASSVSSPSRLNDILPEDIARIEVLSGPAATLYGDGAANGVIVVTTKSGGDGAFRLSGRATWDAAYARDNFPANYQRIGVSPTTGQPVTDCSLVAVQAGQCTPTGLDVWNPLVQASPFHTGNSARVHLETAGAALGTRASFGLTGDRRDGNLPHDDGTRIGTRGKISRPLPWNVSLEASGQYLADDARFGSDIIASGLLGSAQNDADHGYFRGSEVFDSVMPSQILRHATGGVQLRWRPLSWIDASVMTGRDRMTEHGRLEWFGPPPPPPEGEGNILTYGEHALTTSRAQIGVRYSLPHAVAGATAVGYERDMLLTKSIDSTVDNGLVGLTETEFRDRSRAFLLEQRAIVADQIAIAAALERITSGVFGGGAGKEWFPSANLSWTPQLRWRGLSRLQLRAAYAESPNPTASLFSLPTVLVTPLDNQPARPKLERTKQAELGAVASFGDSATMSFTAFRSRSMNLWVSIPVFTGVGQTAEMTNRGLEAFVSTPLIGRRNLTWVASLSMAVLDNEVTKLNEDPIYTVQGSVVQGKPYGGLWARTYTYADANHDGMIDTSEIHLGSYSYFGAPLPRFESSLATDITLLRNVVLSTTLDYRGSYRMFDVTDGSRCRVGVCRAAQDPSAPLDEQAAAAASRLAATSYVAAWAPSVSFMKVREIAIRWLGPPLLTDALGGHVEITVAARNLATWTKYRGLDPEIGSGMPSALPRADYYGMPLPRELVVRLDVNQR